MKYEAPTMSIERFEWKKPITNDEYESGDVNTPTYNSNADSSNTDLFPVIDVFKEL